MARRANPTAGGFTIVELLVVLGIIALLISVLLPSLSRAREQAHRTRCLNNIRQIGMGIAIYLSDFEALPPPDTLTDAARKQGVSLPVYYAQRKSGLLALRTMGGFEPTHLACPDGWASQGNPDWYLSQGLSRNGSAYMDYAYWAGRYPGSEKADKGEKNDPRAVSFLFRHQEKGVKILVTDVLLDQGASQSLLATVGYGNHGSNHRGGMAIVPHTNGQGRRLGGVNRIQSSGGSVLFSDYHATWYPAGRFSQQVAGLCYPPPDQW